MPGAGGSGAKSKDTGAPCPGEVNKKSLEWSVRGECTFTGPHRPAAGEGLTFLNTITPRQVSLLSLY